MLYCNLSYYTIVRDIKDVLLVTSCGAEAIPFMKTWINFPMSIVSMYAFTKLVHIGCNNANIYRILFASVATCYAFVGIVLYPCRSVLQPCNLPWIPSEILALIVYNWVSALFYALASIWGSMVISLLFWLTANDYTNTDDAKRLYPLFGFLGNIALITSGMIINVCGHCFKDNWDMNIQTLSVINVCFAVINMGCFEVLVRRFDSVHTLPLTHANAANAANANANLSEVDGVATTKKNPMLSMFLTNPFVRNMILMIACYGSTMSIYENVWKYSMKQYFANASEYAQYMGMISSIKGGVTMGMMVISSVLLKRIPYRTALLVTPVTITLIGGMFFTSIHLNASTECVVYVGSLIGILSKSLKYAFFDPNKEIAYMQSDKETRTSGKAVIEVLSNPLGKSGSSLVMQCLLLMCGTFADAIPYVSIMFACICATWLYVVRQIGKST